MSDLVIICTKTDIMNVQADDIDRFQLKEEYDEITKKIDELNKAKNVAISKEKKVLTAEIHELNRKKKELACKKRNKSMKRVIIKNLFEDLNGI